MPELSRNAVLAMVARRRGIHGYALAHQLAEWRPEDPEIPRRRAVYKALEKMEKEGLIEECDRPGVRSPDGPGSRGFEVTSAGAGLLAEWMRSAPKTLSDLRLRLRTASSEDIGELADAARELQMACLSRLEQLQPRDLGQLVRDGEPWVAVSNALLEQLEYQELAARAKFLREIQNALLEMLPGRESKGR